MKIEDVQKQIFQVGLVITATVAFLGFIGRMAYTSLGELNTWEKSGIAILAVIASAIKLIGDYVALRKQTEKQDDLRKKVEDEPTKVKPVWELAAFTLETYFQRNLKQVRTIFYVANIVMAAGFGVIVWGIKIAIDDPNRLKIGVIASASGILTEFISFTFMAIYRSTMSQANEYVAVLERINSVGMAVQVLDAMDKDDQEAAGLKNSTRVDIIRLLLTSRGSQTPKLKATKATPKTKAAGPNGTV
jgi:TRADD-N domain-containing protein